MKHLLVVVADHELQRSWQAALTSTQDDWTLHIAETGDEALGFLVAQPVDVVITDIHLPGMPGDVFLRHVSTRHPRTVRLIVADGTEETQALRATGVAHRLLRKSSPESLRRTVAACLSLAALLEGPELLRLATGMTSLPPAPEVFHELQLEVSASDPSFEKVAAIIEREPATAAAVLKIVNSALYGLARPLIDIGEAVRHLGFLKIRDIVLDTALRQAFPCELAGTLQLHAVLCSRFAAELVDDPEEQKIARCAGLVHDVGKLVFATTSQGYSELLDLSSVGDRPLHEWERDVLGVTHAEIGAHVLSLWGLPPAIVEAVALHHEPARVPSVGFDATGAVHVANILVSDHALEDELDLEYLQSIEVRGCVDSWRVAAMALVTTVTG